MRLNTILSWVWYSITLVMGLYCFPFTGLMALGHGLYAIFLEKFNFSGKILKAYLISSLISFLVFIPWLWISLKNLSVISQTTNWSANYKQSLPILSRNWVIGISRLFFDINIRHDSSFSYLLLMGIVTNLVMILLTYSIYFLVKNSALKVYLFILNLIGVTALCLILPDLTLGGIRSTVDRYLIPSYLGIQLCIAYILGININSKNSWKKNWQAIAFILILGGIISNIVISQADNWWLKQVGYQNPSIAHLIDRSEKPLIISDLSSSKLGNVISLSHLLKSSAQFQLVKSARILDISTNYSDIFIYGTSGELRSLLKKSKDFKIVPA